MNNARTGPFWINPDDESVEFPNIELALRDPDGLLAIGGDLSPARLISAYRNGIFPWYNEDQPILWWSPDPRAVLFPNQLHVSRSLQKEMAKNDYTVTINTAFQRVMEACAQPRKDGHGTWITAAMIEAYCRLHTMGFAHSVEIWHGGELSGGIYGVGLGRVFFGESMFGRRTNASKLAFVHLVRRLHDSNYALLDCQVHSAHVKRFGAGFISRKEFTGLLKQWCASGASNILLSGE
ncbi:MAG: leucyl/phenylalanyl-tRNA--protein transferase [Gammaproteobacteria bacterium]